MTRSREPALRHPLGTKPAPIPSSGPTPRPPPRPLRRRPLRSSLPPSCCPRSRLTRRPRPPPPPPPPGRGAPAPPPPLPRRATTDPSPPALVLPQGQDEGDPFLLDTGDQYSLYTSQSTPNGANI